jgi:hypothetical protein
LEGLKTAAISCIGALRRPRVDCCSFSLDSAPVDGVVPPSESASVTPFMDGTVSGIGYFIIQGVSGPSGDFFGSVFSSGGCSTPIGRATHRVS